ncbi:MAG: IS66 family insertion sequence element accessory protein TnpB [Myxococcales bacterium]|nr:IS66 family insertion sequence element accessory protein TnpB [Myxococcales bacterium]
MIGVEGRVRVFAYGAPADMRKGFGGLSGLVREGLGRDPLSGALYLFTNRRRDRAKVLWFDGTGLCVYAKRLERGRFAKLWSAPESDALALTRTELELFLQGSQLVGRVALSPRPLTNEELAVGAKMRQ